MKALELYKFINDNKIEYHWETDPDGDKDVIIYPEPDELKELFKILTPSLFDDGGIPIIMLNGYVAIWASTLLNYYGIELTEIFGEDEQ